MATEALPSDSARARLLQLLPGDFSRELVAVIDDK